jgi:hypothetical protein
MKQVQYIGEEELGFGRFGVINKGAKLDLYEWEWQYEEKHGAGLFKLLSVAPSKEELEVANKVKPAGSPFFDLRTIPWENPKLKTLLASRMSKTTLVKVIKAINFVGGDIVESRSGENRNVLIDRILSAAYMMGWDKYTKEQRLSFGNSEGVEAVVENKEDRTKLARQRVRKTVEEDNGNNS